MARKNTLVGNGVVVSVLDIMENLGPNIVAELLEAGANRNIDLLFEVPRGQHVVLVPNHYCFDWKGALIGVLEPGSTPEYLVLLPKLCDQLLRAKYVELQDAECAYRKMFNVITKEASHLLKTLPVVAGNNPISPVRVEYLSGPSPSEDQVDVKWERWAFKPHNSTVWHRVRVEDLFVISSDFLHWKKWEIDPQASDEYFFGREAPKTVEDVDDDFKSPQLLRMCEAAIKIWAHENVKPYDPSTHPSNQTVMDWLMASGAGFTKTSAENAAQLIRPRFASKPGAPEIKTCSSRKK